jgi:hypothetical protein
MMEKLKIPTGTQLYASLATWKQIAKGAALTGAAPVRAVQVQIQTPDGKGGKTDGKTQMSCDTLVSEWTPDENPDREAR